MQTVARRTRTAATTQGRKLAKTAGTTARAALGAFVAEDPFSEISRSAFSWGAIGAEFIGVLVFYFFLHSAYIGVTRLPDGSDFFIRPLLLSWLLIAFIAVTSFFAVTAAFLPLGGPTWSVFADFYLWQTERPAGTSTAMSSGIVASKVVARWIGAPVGGLLVWAVFTGTKDNVPAGVGRSYPNFVVGSSFVRDYVFYMICAFVSAFLFMFMFIVIVLNDRDKNKKKKWVWNPLLAQSILVGSLVLLGGWTYGAPIMYPADGVGSLLPMIISRHLLGVAHCPQAVCDVTVPVSWSDSLWSYPPAAQCRETAMIRASCRAHQRSGTSLTDFWTAAPLHGLTIARQTDGSHLLSYYEGGISLHSLMILAVLLGNAAAFGTAFGWRSFFKNFLGISYRMRK